MTLVRFQAFPPKMELIENIGWVSKDRKEYPNWFQLGLEEKKINAHVGEWLNPLDLRRESVKSETKSDTQGPLES